MAEQGKKKRRLSPRSIRNRLLIILYVAVVAALIGIVYFYPKVTGAMTEIMTIEYGNLQISDDVDCYIVRDEKVYFADRDGTVGYYYGEGVRARTGSNIIEFKAGEVNDSNNYNDYNSRVSRFLTGYTLTDSSAAEENTDDTAGGDDGSGAAEDNAEAEKQKAIEEALEATGIVDSGVDTQVDVSQIGVRGSFTIPSSGIISYLFDGYESVFTPANMEHFKRKKVEGLDMSVMNFCSGTATAGEPVFKLVNTDAWYAVAWISSSNLGKYEENAKITLKAGNDEVTGRIYGIIDNGDDVMIIMKFDDYYAGLANQRKLKATVITKDYRGLVVDNSFLASEEGVPGVYVVDVTGDTTFVPVNIKASDGKCSILSSGYFYRTEGEETKKIQTVEVYDEIKKVS